MKTTTAKIVYLAGALLAIGLITAPLASAVSLRGDYRFEDNLSSSIAGAPDLVPNGAGVQSFETATVNGVSQQVLTFPEGTGLTMKPAPLTNNGDYSVITTFEWDALDGYQRILAFEPEALDSDSGLYSYDDYLDFYYDDGTNEYGGPSVLQPNEFFTMTLTRDRQDEVKIYNGKAFEIGFEDVLENAVIGSDGLRFFKDDGTENQAGSVARIRIYDAKLGSGKIATILDTGGLAASGSKKGKPKLSPKNPKKAKKLNTRIKLTCPSEGVDCPVRTKIKRVGRQKGVPATLGKLSTTVDPGGSTMPKVKLSKKARKAIKGNGKIEIQADTRITPSSGSTLRIKNKGKV